MILTIRNENKQKIGQIETASVVWHTCYYEPGDFQIYIVATAENVKKLKAGYYVTRKSRESVGIIENIKIDVNEVNQTQYLTVTGRFIESILDRRIILKQTQVKGTIETNIRDLLYRNITIPVDIKRKIVGIGYGPLKGYTESYEAQYTGDNLLTIICETCQTYQTGLRMLANWKNGNFYLELYRGIDRSLNQSENPRVIFSNKNHNLISNSYEETHKNEKTFILIAGEGEGLARRTALLDNGKMGLARKEMYVDARDISSNDGQVNVADYANLLVERGKEKSLENQIIISVEGQVLSTGNIQYYKDYFVGDIVSVENSNWGLSENKRVIEMIESEDENGLIYTPVFATIGGN